MERDAAAAAHCVGPQVGPGMLWRMTTKEKEVRVSSKEYDDVMVMGVVKSVVALQAKGPKG